MNLTLSVDKRIVDRARKKAHSLGETLNQLISDYLQSLAAEDDPECSIQELRALSGRGDSRGRRFSRDQIYRIG